MRRFFLPLALVMVAGSVAIADEVQLRDGHILTGIAKEIDGKIVVETGYGTVVYPRDQVLSILPGNTPLHDYPARFEAIEKSRDAGAFARLGAWARENRLPKFVDGLMRRALELDADNADARAALGYIRHGKRWMTSAEINRDKGQVLFEGRWMLPLEKELLEQRRLDAATRRIDRESAAVERRDAARRAREVAEVQARLRAAEVERELRESAPRRPIRRRIVASGPVWSDAFEILIVGSLLRFSCFGSPGMPFRFPARVY